MAKVVLLYANKRIVSALHSKRYLVDIEFCDEFTYIQAVRFGFDKDVWENYNNNKILINGGFDTFKIHKEKLIYIYKGY